MYVFDGDRTYLVKYPIDDFQLTIDPSSLNSRNIKWIITYYPNIGKELTELEKVRIGYYKIIHKIIIPIANITTVAPRSISRRSNILIIDVKISGLINPHQEFSNCSFLLKQ